MNINVIVIPHEHQRYNTVGDWWFQDYVGANGPTQSLEIRVSQMSDWRHEMAIALHEQYEALLCYNKNISDKYVTAFDVAFEIHKKTSGAYPPKSMAEPGDDPAAPYYAEHAKALVVEYMFLADTDVVRYLYNEELDQLDRDAK
jgi:hypothetical protein